MFTFLKRYRHKVEPLQYLPLADRGMAPPEMSAIHKNSERREDDSASLEVEERLRNPRSKHRKLTFSVRDNPLVS